MSKVGKRVFFDVPGFGRVESMPDATVNFGGVQREAVVADTGVAGYSETPVAPTVAFSLPLKPGLSIQRIKNLVDVNVTVTFDTGQVWIMQKAFVSNAVEASGGMLSVAMSAIRAEEVA